MEVEFMQILVSILLVVIGLSTGVAASIVFNNAKENNASKKAVADFKSSVLRTVITSLFIKLWKPSCR